jgi:hypothetical protein
MQLDLTQFQVKLMTGVINTRVSAQQDEAETVALIFKSSGKDVPDGPIQFKEGKLIYGEEAEVQESVVVE